jgi:hypothetical protein
MPMLTIHFDPPKNNREMTVELTCSGYVCVDPKSCILTLPFDLELTQLVLRVLNAQQYPDYLSVDRLFPEGEDHTALISTLRGLGLWDDKAKEGKGAVAANAHKHLGRQLGSVLLSNAVVKKHFDELYNAASKQKPGEVILSFAPDDKQLVSLPWEVMYDDTDPIPILLTKGDSVNYSRVIRFEDQLLPCPRKERPLRVLTVTPQKGIDPRDRGFVQAARFKMREELNKRLQVQIKSLGPPVTMKTLRECLLKEPAFHILDYIGHGAVTDEGPVLLLDDEQGYSEGATADKLAILPNLPPLIVLNACQSAQVAMNNPFSTIAIALSRAGVQAVLAMQLSLRLEAVAEHIAPTFYRQIADTKSVQQAITEVRRVLYTNEPDTVSWYVPALYLRKPQPYYLLERPLRCPDNPFANTRPIGDSSYFIGRENALAQIRRLLKAGENSFSIIGLRGSGKTSILTLIYKEQLTDGARVIRLMLDERERLTKAKGKLVEQLAPQPGRLKAKPEDYQRLLSDGKHTIILIDDLSKLHSTDEKVREVRHWFKSLLDDSRMRVQIVAGSVDALENIFGADDLAEYKGSSLHSVLSEKIYLEPFTDEEAREFIAKALVGTLFQLEDFEGLLTKPMLPRDLRETCKEHYVKMCKERGLRTDQ